jgi:hypothetical protein
VQQVVYESDEEEEGAGGHHGESLRRVRDEGRVDDDDRQEDGQAAEHRRRRAVPAVGLRLRDHLAAARESPHERGQREREHERRRDGQHLFGGEEHESGAERYEPLLLGRLKSYSMRREKSSGEDGERLVLSS